VADPVNSRDAPRVAVEAFVKADSDDGKEYNFRTRDLSTSGVFLYSRISHAYPFKVGSRLQLELFHDDLQVRCAVVVVRIVEPGSQESQTWPTGFAVRIVAIDNEARGRLESLIARAG
jgi:hypothetical protein